MRKSPGSVVSKFSYMPSSVIFCDHSKIFNAPDFATSLLMYGCFRVGLLAQRGGSSASHFPLYFPYYFPFLFLPSHLILSRLLFLTSVNTGKRFAVKRNKNNTFQDINHTRGKPKGTVTAEKQTLYICNFTCLCILIV